MCDLLLINPSLDDIRNRDENYRFPYASSGHGYMPLFAVALIPYVRKHGFSVKFLDMELYSNRDERRLLEQTAPSARFIGISVMTAQIPQALSITKLVKRMAPHVSVVWGGIHPTLLPEQTVAQRLIDYIVVGEGEEPLVALLSGRDHPRIGAKNKKADLFAEPRFLPMNQLPDPDYDALELERYFRFQGGFRNCDVLTSRGCPFNCSFCVNMILKNHWRGLPVERSVGIINGVRSVHGAKHVFLMDENFFGQADRAGAIIEGIASLGITWEANICIKDVLKLGKGFWKIIRNSGAVRLRMGAESASDRLLHILNKGITREQIAEARDRCLANGITPTLSFMSNLPDELQEEREATVRFADECAKAGAMIIGPQQFRPYPGSAEFQKLVERGMHLPRSVEAWCSTDIFKTGTKDRSFRDKFILPLKRIFPEGKIRTRAMRRIRKKLSFLK
jgi:anaerobic magnesium-protoporphyrin IX monomethyl ester cyclase